MHYKCIESTYSPSFRNDDAKKLGHYIRTHQSIELIGMKHVGINNFLNYFVFNHSVKTKYVKNDKFFYVPIDLNDLMERELLPFWTLMFKRLVDAVQLLDPLDMPDAHKRVIEDSFDKSIQIKDSFMTFDKLRQSIQKCIEHKKYPVFFFIRFDRLIESITPEFLTNLQSLYDASNNKLVYIFTTHREIQELRPDVIEPSVMSTLTQTMYLQPAEKKDMKIICNTFKESFHVDVPELLEENVIDSAGGHVQYLQLALILLDELRRENQITFKKFFSMMNHDERVIMQSEELYSHLFEHERPILHKIVAKGTLTKKEKVDGKYILDTGMARKVGKKYVVFNAYFEDFIRTRFVDTSAPSGLIHLTQKENSLFEILQQYEGKVCDRETIIEHVWSEFASIGVSDWAVDRLVARLRKKLEEMGEGYKIDTIRTRGFMLYRE